MITVAIAYLVLVWLLFSSLRMLRLSWFIYDATIIAIPEGIGESQIAVSGILARISALGGTSAYPAQRSIPDQADRTMLRLGTSGTATVFAENAGVIGLIARIHLGAVLHGLSLRTATTRSMTATKEFDR